MRATRKQIAEANRIAARFGGWREIVRDFADGKDYEIKINEVAL